MDIVHFLRQMTLGVSITLVLLYVLLQNELLRAHGGRRAVQVAQVTTIVGAPVLVLFVVVITIRFLTLMRVI